MAKQKANGSCKYCFSEDVTELTVQRETGEKDKNNKLIFEPKTGKAVRPFGLNTEPFFEDELTDAIAEWLLTKPELKGMIVKKK